MTSNAYLASTSLSQSQAKLANVCSSKSSEDHRHWPARTVWISLHFWLQVVNCCFEFLNQWIIFLPLVNTFTINLQCFSVQVFPKKQFQSLYQWYITTSHIASLHSYYIYVAFTLLPRFACFKTHQILKLSLSMQARFTELERDEFTKYVPANVLVLNWMA